MSNAETITVPHLGTSTIGYRLGKPYDASLPTLVMVNSFTTSVELYRPQFADEELSAAANLLALEPYGHGQTRASYEQFTYWDSAVANLQVLDALGIPEAFVLGTSQGGWVAARMAMLAPGTVKGIIPLGTSMDFESQRSRDLGCWDGIELLHAGHRRTRRERRRRLGHPGRARRRRPQGGLRRGRAARGAHVLARDPPEELHRRCGA